MRPGSPGSESGSSESSVATSNSTSVSTTASAKVTAFAECSLGRLSWPHFFPYLSPCPRFEPISMRLNADLVPVTFLRVLSIIVGTGFKPTTPKSRANRYHSGNYFSVGPGYEPATLKSREMLVNSYPPPWPNTSNNLIWTLKMISAGSRGQKGSKCSFIICHQRTPQNTKANYSEAYREYFWLGQSTCLVNAALEWQKISVS